MWTQSSCRRRRKNRQRRKTFNKHGAKTLQKENIDIDGPLSADSLFTSQNIKKYRLILGSYHDQVLIPFKALEGS